MTDFPLVSVLMTVYNREKFIAQAIESVLGANYKNLELIIVDDGSVDESMKIAEYYTTRDSRIKIYYNEQNLGDYPNRNRAATYAKGKYLKYVDSDDFVYPDWFTVMVDAMEKFPEAGLGLNRFVRNSENSGPFYYNSEQAWRLHFFQRPVFGASPLSAIMRRDVFESLGGFSNIRYSGDLDMWLKMTSKSGLVITEHPLAEWRSHGDQEKEKGADHYLMTGRLIEKKYLEADACPLKATDRGAALRLVYISHVLKILMHLKRNKISTAQKLKKAYGISWVQIINTILAKLKYGPNLYNKLQRKNLGNSI
ncbi:MAG: glycosyltransferase family 2 protein [Cyclobacteriaceae bacterium]|nr:glycosyltransferase family 2 protein [Cyclobacteriaceae bacterium]